MTFRVGDIVVRKREEDNSTWMQECNKLKLVPFAPYTVREIRSNMECLRLKELPVNVLWVSERFTFATVPDRNLEDYL